MDQHSRNVSDTSDSDCSSLPYSMSYSETESLVESVGSAEAESGEEQTPTPGGLLGRSRKVTSSSGSQFIQFSKELRDVPAKAAWEFVRNHRNVTNLVPGIIEGIEYIEGDGGTGSVFVGIFSSEYYCTTQGDDKTMIYRIEVTDDVSRMYAARCVGGLPLKFYSFYMSYMTVISHKVLGDSSSVLIWRLEYELRDPECPDHKESIRQYPCTMDLIRKRCVILNRVDRPPVTPARMTANRAKRLKMQARQQRRIEDDEQELDPPSERRKKPKAHLLLNTRESTESAEMVRKS